MGPKGVPTTPFSTVSIAESGEPLQQVPRTLSTVVVKGWKKNLESGMTAAVAHSSTLLLSDGLVFVRAENLHNVSFHGDESY